MAYLWYLSIVHFAESSEVNGVIVKGNPKAERAQQGAIVNGMAVLSSYFTKVAKHKKIRVEIGDQTIDSETDDMGTFKLEVDFRIDGNVKILENDDNKLIEPIQKYPIEFQHSKEEINVISDIDETILTSYTRTKVKRFLTTLLTPPQKRKVISSTNELYRMLSERSARYFYVSKSEANLFPTISNFILHQELPKGALYLTPFLQVFQLIGSSKERSFKHRTISRIMDRIPNGTFILIGDDTQRDLEIYGQVAHRYKERIEGIFIRRTRLRITGKQLEAEKKIKALGVNVNYIGMEELINNKEKL